MSEKHVHRSHNLPSVGIIDALPGIAFIANGFWCPVEGCNIAKSSSRTLKAHLRDHNLSDSSPTVIRGPIQSLFASNQMFYRVRLPSSSSITAPISTQPQQSIADSGWEAYNSLVEERYTESILEDSAHLTPFLAKYHWHKKVEDLAPSDVIEWTSYDNVELRWLHQATQDYYESITVKILSDDSWSTVLRWILSENK